jgi:hypothetical protein
MRSQVLYKFETVAMAAESLILMKRILLVLTLGAALGSPAFAQSADSTNAAPPGPAHHRHWDAVLTDAERQELHTAHDAAIQANPDLATEGKDLMDKMKAAHDSGVKPDADLMDQMHAYMEKLNEAMIKADANVAPILAKLKAAHHHHDGQDGPPPATPPSNT